MRKNRLIAKIVTVALIVLSLRARGSGVGVSSPGHNAANPAPAGPITTKPFIVYRSPLLVRPLANRDIEFLWSQHYQDLGAPLVEPGPGDNDLDRLADAICKDPHNPFGFPATDIRLIFDYLNQAGLTYNAANANPPVSA
jgi:hypothetical protein